MKKFLLLALSLFVTPVLFAAEPGETPVNENAFLAQKEISVWATDQTYNTQAAVYSCQAVRIHPNWFLTSAHCVYTACATRPCTVQVTLAQSEIALNVRIKHSTSSQSVYIYDGFFPGQNRISGVDAALIRFTPEKAEYSYTRTADGAPLTQGEFNKLLKFDAEAQLQLDASGARLLSVANTPTVRLTPRIVVPKIVSGQISYLENPSSEVFFLGDLQHFLSPGFGVRRGNSGGGVFTRQGDLAGVVSSLLYAQDGSASFQDAEGKTVLTLKNASNYFLFTGFNGATLNFIRNKVPGLRTVSVLPDFAVPSNKKFQSIVEAVNGSSLRF